MSDSESFTSDQIETSMDQEPKEPSSPTQDEPSAETQSDSSTDVAPTRKTRRRPEHKPPPEEQKSPETQKPAERATDVSQVTFNYIWLLTIQIVSKQLHNIKIGK